MMSWDNEVKQLVASYDILYLDCNYNNNTNTYESDNSRVHIRTATNLTSSWFLLIFY